MAKGNRLARPTKRDYAAAESFNDAILTAMAGPYNKEPFWELFFHHYSPGDEKRLARVAAIMAEAVERGDPAFFEQVAAFLRWLKTRKPGDCAPDPDAAAVLYGVMHERQVRNDPSWSPSDKEILAMLPASEKGREMKQAQRVREKIRHAL